MSYLLHTSDRVQLDGVGTVTVEEAMGRCVQQAREIARLVALLEDVHYQLRQADPRYPEQTCRFDDLIDRIEVVLHEARERGRDD